MSLPFDATLKGLIERYPEDWVRLLGLPVTGPVTLLNADVSTYSSQADKVVSVGGKTPWLAHTELQASRDDTLEARTLYTNVAVAVRHSLPVKSLVVLLRPEAEEKRNPLTGVVRLTLPEEGSYLEFHYSVVRLWLLPPDTLLTAGLGLLPLAPLAKVTKRELPQVIRRMEARIAAEMDKAQAADLWVATYILMGLRFDPSFASDVLKGVRGLEESTTYQEIIKIGEARGEARGRAEGEARGRAEGEARGRAEGEARGRAEGEGREARKVLLRVGRRRLGEPDAATQDTIDALRDVEQIETLIERVLEVENWAELFPPPTA